MPVGRALRAAEPGASRPWVTHPRPKAAHRGAAPPRDGGHPMRHPGRPGWPPRSARDPRWRSSRKDSCSRHPLAREPKASLEACACERPKPAAPTGATALHASEPSRRRPDEERPEGATQIPTTTNHDSPRRRAPCPHAPRCYSRTQWPTASSSPLNLAGRKATPFGASNVLPNGNWMMVPSGAIL